MLFQILFSVLSVCVIGMAWRRVRQGALRMGEGILWVIGWIGASIVVWRPETTSLIAHVFGIGRGVDFVVYASIIFLGCLFFILATAIDRLERQMTTLVQREALDRFEREQQKKL